MSVIVGSAVWPIAARAQQDRQVRRLGILMPFAENDEQGRKYVAALVQHLHELGWQDGSNLHIDYRWAGPEAGRIRSGLSKAQGPFDPGQGALS